MTTSTMFNRLISIIIFSCILGSIFVAVLRIFLETTLLFDQFVLATFFVFVQSFLIQKYKKFRIEPHDNRFLKIVTAGFTALFFFSTIQYSILAVDRSRSLYIFKWVDDGKIKIGNDALEFTNIPNNHEDIVAIQQRVEEQIKRKLMAQNGREITLTYGGKALLVIAESSAYFFNLRGWYSNT